MVLAPDLLSRLAGMPEPAPTGRPAAPATRLPLEATVACTSSRVRSAGSYTSVSRPSGPVLSPNVSTGRPSFSSTVTHRLASGVPCG